MPTRSRSRSAVEAAAFTLALAGAALVARFDAGLADAWVLVGLATAVPLYVVARGWNLSAWFHAVAALLPAGVVMAALVHGYADGSARAARYAYGAVLFLAILAWARDPARRLAAGVGIVLLAADAYLVAWWIWWGGGNAFKSMYGNFYTQNVFATYLVVGAAVAVFLVVLGSRVSVLAGFVVVSLTGAGVLASGSRSGLLMLAAAILAAAVAGLIARGARSLLRTALVVAAVAGTSAFMAGPVFFPESAGMLRALERTDAGFSIMSRFSFWRDSPVFFAQSPLVGHGLQSFGPMIQCHSDGAYSSHPHNESLLAAVETGVIGLAPFVLIAVGVVLLVVRVLRPAGADGTRRWRLPSREALLADPAAWGALVAVVLAFAHVNFDFDWAFPSLIALTAIAAGVAAGPYVVREVRSRPMFALNLVLVAIALALAVAGFMMDPLPSQNLRPLPLDRFDCPNW